MIMRERELQQLSLAFCSSNAQTISLKQEGEQFNTYQEESNPNQDQSIRKRARIFEPRPSQVDLGQHHRESSKIMQENSTNDYTKQKSSKTSDDPQRHPNSHTQSPPNSHTQSHPNSHTQSHPYSHMQYLPAPLVSAAVQTAYEYPLPSACLKLQGE